MNFYKKAILTLTGAGMMLGCTHKELEEPILGTIIDTATRNGNTKCYLDIDNDGLVDREMQVHDWICFDEYASAGDTIRYRTTDKNTPYLNAGLPFCNSVIIDINGRTRDELEQRRQINKMRERLGQEKQR